MHESRSQVGGAGFFSLVSRKAAILFFAAVFFTFAPIGLLVASSFERAISPSATLVFWLLSGGVAVSWAATFTVSRWFIAGIVVFQAGMFVFFSSIGRQWHGYGGGTFSLEGVGSTVAIVIGYVLFVIFINGQGNTVVRLQTEMDLARQIHETLVPPLSLTEQRFEVFGVSRASTEMGGDLIDVVHHDAGTDIIVADVSGHGVKAGVVMAMVKSAVRARLQSPVELGDLLTGLNRLLEQTTSSGMFSTFVGIRIPASGGELEYAIAGHDGLTQFRRNGAPTRHGNEHMPLGLLDQVCTSRTLCAEPGDLLAVYTDGLNETESEDGAELGHDPIERIIQQAQAEPLEQIHHRVFELVESHGEQVDDRSLLLLRILRAS